MNIPEGNYYNYDKQMLSTDALLRTVDIPGGPLNGPCHNHRTITVRLASKTLLKTLYIALISGAPFEIASDGAFLSQIRLSDPYQAVIIHYRRFHFVRLLLRWFSSDTSTSLVGDEQCIGIMVYFYCICIRTYYLYALRLVCLKS